MTLRSLALSGLIALSAVSLSLRARADDPAPGGAAAPQAKTARECVQGCIDCMAKGDYDGAAAWYAAPMRTGMAKLLKGTAALEKACARLKAAAEAKLGAGAGAFVATGPSPERSIQDAKEDGDHAVVTVLLKQKGRKDRQQSFDCWKEDGTWSIGGPKASHDAMKSAPDLTSKITIVLGDAMQKSADDTGALAADVESGKCTSKDDAKTRFKKIQEALAATMKDPASALPSK